MRTHRGPRVDATILGAASLLALAMGPGLPESETAAPGTRFVVGTGIPAANLVGGWATADRTVKLNLRADGRYERSIAGRARSAQGTYRVERDSVLLRDDSGLRTTVTFYGDTMEMAGHRLRPS